MLGPVIEVSNSIIGVIFYCRMFDRTVMQLFFFNMRTLLLWLVALVRALTISGGGVEGTQHFAIRPNEKRTVQHYPVFAVILCII